MLPYAEKLTKQLMAFIEYFVGVPGKTTRNMIATLELPSIIKLQAASADPTNATALPTTINTLLGCISSFWLQ